MELRYAEAKSNRNEQDQDDRFLIEQNDEFPSNKSVKVISLVNNKNKIISYLYLYAVHSVVLFDVNLKDGGMLLSGDLVGKVSSLIESNTNVPVALFLLAPCGDQNPKQVGVINKVKNRKKERIDLGAKALPLLRLQAHDLATAVINSVPVKTKTDIKTGISSKIKTIQIDGKNERIDLRLSLVKR